MPGARDSAATWTDASGNLWLFGGHGYDSAGTAGLLNDLWKYTPSTGNWTWVGGSNIVLPINSPQGAGIYGTRGQPAPANLPGARAGAVSWADSSGNLWLFGGNGYDSTGLDGDLNDLWEYSPSTGEWTWVGGPDTGGGYQPSQMGVYGTQGQAATANLPGARDSAIAWADASGNLWLFGGDGYDSLGVYGQLDDLWKYTPSMGEWTWVSGCNLAYCVFPPGARQSAVAWIDHSGNFWLFGGYGYASANANPENPECENDLWEYTPSTGQWTQIPETTKEDPGTGAWMPDYGTLGQPATTNVPGSRTGAVAWTDASGNLWLFGGYGYDATVVNSTPFVGYLNDLWKFSPATGEWTWEGGPNTQGPPGGGQPSVYGTLDEAAATNLPGARDNAVSWTDASGNVWLFGGDGFGESDTAGGDLNDLWWLQSSTAGGCSGFGCE